MCVWKYSWLKVHNTRLDFREIFFSSSTLGMVLGITSNKCLSVKLDIFLLKWYDFHMHPVPIDIFFIGHLMDSTVNVIIMLIFSYKTYRHFCPDLSYITL